MKHESASLPVKAMPWTTYSTLLGTLAESLGLLIKILMFANKDRYRSRQQKSYFCC
jgi:hypothetical protein